MNPDSVRVTLTVNGVSREAEAQPRMLLADFIRHRLGLTGTHIGCEQGVCGACTVMVNGSSARSCLLFAIQMQNAEITTVEGLSNGDQLTPLQQAFHECHALQCGFCTPGFLIILTEFLRENANPSDDEINEVLSGNLCRCTGYINMQKAVRLAAQRMSGR